MKYLFLLCLVILQGSSRAQYRKTIDSLAAICQACLDKGEHMTRCSGVFYNQMDSIMNDLFRKKLTAQKNAAKGDAMKIDQFEWLKKKEAFLKKEDIKYKKAIASGEWGRDYMMIIYDEEAQFVKRRINYLLFLK